MLIIAINTSKYTNILRMTALHFTYPACLWVPYGFYNKQIIFWVTGPSKGHEVLSL
jgi:hypothetical protein